ncbi:hypothetical protein CUMW_228580 [Citrus unshiu]|uniref:Uncharacterized protein n=1 Tax=Citrus unshiu TaxID=55188 RepID=A0A2H5QGP2_CITUN|nr:hypothetical protein CUMW_228580 [Citrus unshiu]
MKFNHFHDLLPMCACACVGQGDCMGNTTLRSKLRDIKKKKKIENVTKLTNICKREPVAEGSEDHADSNIGIIMMGNGTDVKHLQLSMILELFCYGSVHWLCVTAYSVGFILCYKAMKLLTDEAPSHS